MGARWTRVGVEAAAAGLLLATAACDGLGAAAASFYLLVVAVPVTAVAGLVRLGDAVDSGRGRARPAVLALLVGALVLGAAAREPALREGAIPPAATAALVVGFVLLAAQAVLALGPARR